MYVRQKMVPSGLEQEETEAGTGMEWERQRGADITSPKRLEIWKYLFWQWEKVKILFEIRMCL